MLILTRRIGETLMIGDENTWFDKQVRVHETKSTEKWHIPYRSKIVAQELLYKHVDLYYKAFNS